MTPLYLVQALEVEIQYLDWNPASDTAWCVFDIEQSGTHPTLQKAVDIAKKRGYHLALSNPAFEYWILLHYERTGRAFTNAVEVIKTLNRYIPTYSKSMSIFQLVHEHTKQAIENTEVLRSLHEKRWEDFPNPSTGVDLLVKMLWDGS